MPSNHLARDDVGLIGPARSAGSDTPGVGEDTDLTGPLRVVEIDPEADRRWADFVTAHPDGHVYHHPAWSQVIEETYGYQPAHLACEDASGNLLGVLPLFSQRGLISGRRLVSLPHTPVCGPLTTSPTATAALLRAAVERARSGGNQGLMIKADAPDLCADGEVLAPVQWDPTYVVDLPSPPEPPPFLSSRHRERIKRAVKKALKNGVVTREVHTLDELREWYHLYLLTMRRLGVPPRSFRFFSVAWERLRPLGLMSVLLAELPTPDGTKMLGGCVYFPCARTTMFAFTGYRQDALSLRPNDLIQWTAIHTAWEQGHHRFDLGEVEPGDDGLARFKLKWGAEPRPLYRYFYPAPKDVVMDVVASRGRMRAAAQATWRMLPLTVTQHLGEWIYQYL